ncbi:MAG: XdhC family protein [Desulfurococcaceae archaeon]|nr:XdhC family protein [Desulfurococcaceae archaeon]
MASGGDVLKELLGGDLPGVPTSYSELQLVRVAEEYLSRGLRLALCTIVRKEGSAPRDVGAKILVGEDGRVFGTLGGGPFEALVVSDALKAISEGTPRLVKYSFTGSTVEGARDTGLICGGVVEVFIDVLRPPPRAILVGFGRVGRPLYSFLRTLGFDVLVFDTSGDAVRELVESGYSGVYVGPVEELVPRFREVSRSSDYVFVVYGEVEVDYTFVREALRSGVRAVWLLGSRRKVTEFVRRLLSEGLNPEEVSSRLRAPMGLDIGADTPEEVALSAAAEVVATMRGAQVRSLNIVPEVVAKLMSGGRVGV